MRPSRAPAAPIAAGMLLLAGMTLAPGEARAQVRGVYPTGMNATNAGNTPDPGLTYSNLFIFNSRDELRGTDGELLATGQQSVLIDLNTLAWVSRRTLAGGAHYSATVSLLLSNNSLDSDAQGSLGGGGGFGDSFYQPFILGWQTDRLGARVAYGLLAPTGRFHAGASDNVGSGYWTHAPSAGLTLALSRDRTTSFSAFGMYEIHTTQEDTDIDPGDTFDVDTSIAHTFHVSDDLSVQAALVAYGQWQTSDKTGPAVTREESERRYRVAAAGLAANLVFPQRKASIGFKFFHEFEARSTFKGYCVQISGAIHF